MKNALFATTSLVAVAIAGAASANEGFTTTVGGYITGGVGFADETGFDATSFDARTEKDGVALIRDGEIHFTAKTVTDNGLTFGVRVELEAATSSDQIDENYAWVEGAFGRLEIGGNDEARTRLGTGVLYGNTGYGGYFDQDNLLDTGYDSVNDSDSLGIHYFTPSFYGLQGAISYQPDQGVDGSGDANVAFDGDTNAFGSDALSLAANYTADYGDIEVSVAGGYTFKDSGSAVAGFSRPDADIWSAGATFGYAGFTLAAYYQDNADVAVSPAAGGATFKGVTYNWGDYVLDQGQTIALGISYATGPWTFGGGYSFNVSGETDFGTGSGKGDFDRSMAGAWVAYDLAPGVVVSAVVEYGEEEISNPNAASGQNSIKTDGFAAATTMRLTF